MLKNRILRGASYLMFAAISFVLSSCEKEEVILLSSITVNLTMASDYNAIPVGNIVVKITNTQDNFIDSAFTSITGSVTFSDLPPGTYNVSASKFLNSSQVFNSTGYNTELTLNANSDGVSPLPGQSLSVSLVMDGRPAGSLLIKQLYYGAGKVPQLPLLLLKDQFIEIYNNSEEVIYADGLYIAVLCPRPAGYRNDIVSPLSKDEYLYAEQVLRIPGTGTQHPLHPGNSLVVAANGIDFTEEGKYPAGTVNNSKADFEVNETAWLQARGFVGNPVLDSPNNPDVPDVEIVYFWASHGSFFYFNADGSSVAIFRMSTTPTETVIDPTVPNYPFLKIPVSAVIDAADFLAQEDSAPFKRLPTFLDASFNFIPGGSRSTGKSMVRKVVRSVGSRAVLMDTNNSANDFEYKDVQQY